MGCSSGGCASGCSIKGLAAANGGSAGSGSADSGGCGSTGCASGNCGADTFDGNYRDVVGVKIGNHAKTWYYDSTGFGLLSGDGCVVEGDQGEEYGTVVQPTGASRKFAGQKDMKRVLRRATSDDLDVHRQTGAVRREALEYCRSRIPHLKLEMKIANVEPSFDGKKITFYFTAEERVDFRELVRDIAQHFRRRVEMRQIGARDEAKIIGGYGICGRPLCCTTFLTEFAPISIKMAKRQGLGLNPSKISGQCGRLMCCLRYEDYEPSKEARKDDAPPSPPAPPAPSSPSPA